MQSIKVELTDKHTARDYPIHIGSGLLGNEALFAPFLKPGKVAVVSNQVVAPLYLAPLQACLGRLDIEVLPVILPDGEIHKDWATLNHIFDSLLTAHCERHTPLLALGGGVVGDMAGFAAACFQRGMPFIQVPTTLLSQVDSSVGGKTAINHPLGKNMIGAFYQPLLVVADIDTLQSLPRRELRAGLAEVVKYGLIRDADFFLWLEQHAEGLLALDAELISAAILRSCKHKAAVVAADERERGERALLNFGHTFGHAIETGMGYGNWLHGEAVAAGMVIAARLSADLGWIARADVQRIVDLLHRLGLPTRAADLEPEYYLELMLHDKKVCDGKLTLVLLRAIGQAVLSTEVPTAQIQAAIAASI